MTCPCFVAGTLVTMADGTHKPIQDVQPGEQVLSRDPITGEVKAEPVAQVFTHPTDQTVTVTLSDGETLTCTPSHPFYVAGRGFVPAGELTQGEPLVSGAEAQGATGTCAAVTVSQVAWQKASAGTETVVYNLGIASTHTYFVGSDDGGVWVHNTCSESPDFDSPIQLSFKFPKNPLHHVFPQEFEEYWEAADIDMDKWTVSVRQAEHDALHAGSRPGGAWNEEWEAYIEQNPVPNSQSAWQQAYSMMKNYGIDGRPFYKY